LFYNSYFFIVFFLKIFFFYRDILPFNWHKYTYSLIESFEFFHFYIASPILDMCTKPLSLFRSVSKNHIYGYEQAVDFAYIFPSPIMRIEHCVGHYNASKFFFTYFIF